MIIGVPAHWFDEVPVIQFLGTSFYANRFPITYISDYLSWITSLSLHLLPLHFRILQKSRTSRRYIYIFIYRYTYTHIYTHTYIYYTFTKMHIHTHNIYINKYILVYCNYTYVYVYFVTIISTYMYTKHFFLSFFIFLKHFYLYTDIDV